MWLRGIKARANQLWKQQRPLFIVEESEDPPPLDIYPTATLSKDALKYSDTALSNLLNTHGAQINSMRQAIWQRFSAMVVANSVILVFTAGSRASSSHFYNTVGPVLGILLCAVWYMLTNVDRSFFDILLRTAGQFRWAFGPSANPFYNLIDQDKYQWGTRIYRLAHFVILLFFVAYVVTLAFSLVHGHGFED
jgi:hypothetical protein